MSAAAVVAVRVVLRVALPLASRPAGPPKRRAGAPSDRGERPHQAPGDHDHAEEERQGARRRRGSATRPIGADAGRARHGQPRPRRRGSPAGRTAGATPSRGGSVAPSRSAATGAIWVARRAGEMLAMQRDHDAQRERHDDRARLDHHRGAAAGRRRTPRRARSGPWPAPRRARGRRREAKTPMTRPSVSTERLIWRLRRAERAQRGELADALGERDRERVEDHERARRRAR